jgi:hypothetical protein
VGPCGAARIGYGDSVLNDPDSRRLSVMVACEWSHARCEWSLTQRPRVGRSLGPGAGGSARAARRRRAAGASQAPKPSAEIPAPETGEISSSQRRDTTDRGRTRIPPAACRLGTHNSNSNSKLNNYHRAP